MRKRNVLLGLTAVFFAVLIQVPQWIHMADARYQGVLVHLNADEDVYQARVEEALNGRPKQASEAIIGDPSLVNSQAGLLETIVGTVFRPTGLRAPAVLQILDSFVIVGVFLSLLWFFRQSGFGPGASYVGAVFFVLLQLNNLNRPMYPGLSFLVMLMSLNGLIAGMRGRTWLGIIGGALLGLLIGIYFWSWTFAWLWVGLFFVWQAIGWWKTRSSVDRTALSRLVVFALIGLVAAAPFVWQLISLSHHPLYEQAAFRSGMHPSHLPESLPYSVLFIGMTIFVLLALYARYESLSKYRPAVVTILAAFIVIHQEVIHGVVFNFVSHYLSSLVLAAICVLLLAWELRSRLLVPAALCACIYLAAVGYDGRWVLKQFSANATDFQEQHFASALPILDNLPRATILSDPFTSLFLASNTKHDVVYTVYLKNVLISHEEIGERYCLSVLPMPPAERHIEEQEWLIYPDANSAFDDDPSVRTREVAMVKDACARMDRDPETYLKKYHVDAIFWDEQRQPDWDLHRIHAQLTKLSSGSGWSLWQIP